MTRAVECRAVTKRFGDVVAVVDASLDVRAGEIVALLGPSGCGKTTLLRLIAGFERPDAGSIALSGATVAGGSQWVQPERRRVAFVFQDYALFPHLSVAGNVGFGVADRRARPDRVRDALALVGLEGLADRYPQDLSGGQQQRVALARALAPQPALVLLDEPFSNLDADLRVRVRSEVRDILRRANATAIFVTHDQDEAFDIADRVAVMNRGSIEQIGSAEEIYHTPATKFVADFVGEAEFLPACVGDGSLETELGSFPLPRVAAGPAEIMIRPEDIRLTRDPAGDAVVSARRFRGPLNLTVVRLSSGVRLASAHSSQTAFDVGERVRVSFSPDHLVVFRADELLACDTVRAPARPDGV